MPMRNPGHKQLGACPCEQHSPSESGRFFSAPVVHKGGAALGAAGQQAVGLPHGQAREVLGIGVAP